MTALTIVLTVLAAVSGCVCVCADVEVAFETACRERGGRVQALARGSELCVADAGVIATWSVDEDAGEP